MSKLPLVYYPNPLLLQECAEVEDINQIQSLIDSMILTMYAENGIGLAAPQVGKNIQLTVIDLSPEQNKPQVFINPKIIEKTGQIDSEEGCLSIPGFRDIIHRFEKVKVKALDRDGKEFTVEAEELFSRCLQHEIDHLNGVLFIDYLSPLKVKFFRRWYKKNMPLGAEE